MIYDAERGDISITVAGDAMITRRMQPFKEERFLKLVDILRAADVTLINAEMLFHDWEMSWQIKDSISFQASDPENLTELKWMGIDAVSTANNHSYDYSEAGFLATLRNIKAKGVLQAGGGRNLGEARAPAYVDSARGRVAFMAAASSYSEDARAGLGRSDFQGTPGINALRHNTAHTIREEHFGALRELKQEMGIEEQEEVARRFQPQNVVEYDKNTEVRFLREKFLLGEEYRLSTACNKEDLASIGNWIRGAKKYAEWAVYSIHCHDAGSSEEVEGLPREWGETHGGVSRTSPADYLKEFAHWTIDQGVNLFFAHGPHFLKGIEIYQGKPIFYSLGNFIFQNDAVQWIPEPGYRGQKLGDDHTPGDWGWGRSGGGEFGFPSDPVFYRSAVAVCDYVKGELKEVRLHPIDLGFGRPIPQRGRPVLAEGDVAQTVLTWLQDVSKPFGTKIEIEGDTGVIRL